MADEFVLVVEDPRHKHAEDDYHDALEYERYLAWLAEADRDANSDFEWEPRYGDYDD